MTESPIAPGVNLVTGKIVQANNGDSVRIEGENGQTLTIPASVILAADRVLRYCTIHHEDCTIDICETESGVECFQAQINFAIYGEIAGGCWGALANLAAELDARNLR